MLPLLGPEEEEEEEEGERGREGGRVSQEMKRASGFEVSLWFLKYAARAALAQRGSPIYYNLWKFKVLS